MNKQEFLKELQNKYIEFEKIHYEIVDLVNEFLSNEENQYTVDTNYDLRNVEQLCFTYAWIIDRLNNRIGFVGGKGYNKSMSKKIRKALGYSI